jgi:4-diphosphocytidyl-2-C-methyl-D-erythritol kinase
LILRVLGRRPDGYHEVITLLQTVSLHDDLHLAKRDDGRLILHCEATDVPLDDSNLIIRAGRLLAQRYKVTSGAEIQLEKHIPVRAGLGGASANAAVALLGLAEILNLELDPDSFIDLAKELGADVPFFLFGGTALATGTGTVVKPLADTAPLDLLIVTPKAQISTAEAYSTLHSTSLTTTDSLPILAGSLVEEFSTDWHQWSLQNDFERVIFEKEPEIERVQKCLLAVGASKTLLAGSGSSVFGIFESAEAQQRALGQIETEAGWRIFPCRTVSRDEYVRALDRCGTSLLRSF